MRLFFAWLVLSVFLLLSFVVLIAIETLTREYPKWQWWMATVPVNIFTDAFIPVVVFSIYRFSIPIGFITLLLILSYILKWNKYRQISEIICYILSIIIL